MSKNTVNAEAVQTARIVAPDASPYMNDDEAAAHLKTTRWGIAQPIRVGDLQAKKVGKRLVTTILTALAIGLSELHAIFGNNRSAQRLGTKITSLIPQGLIVPTIKDSNRETVQAWRLK